MSSKYFGDEISYVVEAAAEVLDIPVSGTRVRQKSRAAAHDFQIIRTTN